MTALRLALESTSAPWSSPACTSTTPPNSASSALFGPLTTAHPTVPSVDGALHVLPVDSERGKSNRWHTDVTFVVNPPQLSSLRSLVVPPYGGETLVADSGAAYRALPEPLARFADTLWAVHSNLYDYAVADQPLDEAAAERPQGVHFDRVRDGPSGRAGASADQASAACSSAASPEGSSDCRRTSPVTSCGCCSPTSRRPEHVLRWRWSENQLLLFDNRITQHYAIDNYDDLPAAAPPSDRCR